MPVRNLAHLLLILCMAGAPASQPAGDLPKQCAATLRQWHPKFEAEHLSYLISPPYLIAGDGSQQDLAGYRDHTILSATRALQAEFFAKHPTEPIVILLFESSESYDRLADKFFGEKPDTPYGYFRRDGVMVMNVATGTGTLVHELTHALIKPDFPDVPDWFNEGLGSLFEQSSINGDTIRGLPNWRLPALQRAIRTDKLRPLREMINDPQFYGEAHVGLNYAQARYLLMYLQQIHRLDQFYKDLKSNHADDPTGIKTLEGIAHPKTLEAFEKDWREWVLGLRLVR